jgi:hypothetical protein
MNMFALFIRREDSEVGHKETITDLKHPRLAPAGSKGFSTLW